MLLTTTTSMINFTFIVLLLTIQNITCSLPKPDTSSGCLTCEAFVERMYTTWTNETTVEGILNKMEKACANIPDPDTIATCDKIAEVLVQIPPSLFEGMEDLAWPVPKATCALIQKCHVPCCNANAGPEQIHLSLASTDHSLMGVTWVTLNDIPTVVRYGTSSDDLSQTVTGKTNTYTQAGWIGTIHKATMIDLKPSTIYYYQVGGGENEKWSQIYSFKTYNPNEEVTRFGVIADMDFGHASDNTVASLIKLVENDEIDVIIHSGDVSYADGYEPHWDIFWNKVQPIAARVPYMTTPGNHEFWFNFTAYKARVFMPGSGIDEGGSGDSMYYSWEYGPIHFTALNSETAIDIGNFDENMLKWAENDMSSINRDKNRGTPWLISHFHRPMYCSDDHSCEAKNSGRLRHQAEEIFHDNKVDLVLYGHVHGYERTSPVYKNQELPAGHAPVYILQGGSGNREGNKGDTWPNPDNTRSWSKKQSNTVGYGIMLATSDEISWKFYEAGTDKQIDETKLKK